MAAKRSNRTSVAALSTVQHCIHLSVSKSALDSPDCGMMLSNFPRRSAVGALLQDAMAALLSHRKKAPLFQSAADLFS
jgi:hypothetical protein